jgi:hypothetical protein
MGVAIKPHRCTPAGPCLFGILLMRVLLCKVLAHCRGSGKGVAGRQAGKPRGREQAALNR